MVIFLCLSMDSFLASLAFASLGLSLKRRQILCVLLGMCDGLAVLAGPHLGFVAALAHHTSRQPILFIGILAWMLIVAWLVRRITLLKSANVAELLLVPLILSFDNLLASPLLPGTAVSISEAAFVAGILSVIVAIIGYQMGTLCRKRVSNVVAVRLGTGVLFLLPLLF